MTLATSAAPAAVTSPSWPVFETPLVGRELVAERTMSFRFTKPRGWSYRAGQFVDITLLDPPETDAEGNLRGFSISSAPREEVITITTRLRDTAFKRVLQAMPLGTLVKMEGPFGDLRLHHAARPAVLLAGGIGITPFRSILVETIGGGALPYPVVLFHANRRSEDAAFADEFRSLARRDPNLTFVPTMTATGWLGTTPGAASEVTSTPPCSDATWTDWSTPSITSPDRRAWSRRCGRCSSHRAWMRTTCASRSSPATRSVRSSRCAVVHAEFTRVRCRVRVCSLWSKGPDVARPGGPRRRAGSNDPPSC